MNHKDSRWFQDAIIQWYEKYGRKNLPWQKNRNPYRVWISEIMLQQTQVKTVLPYYERFLERFPDISTLAHAEEDDVLALWSGLGYYSRARNLHKTAKFICEQHQEKFPRDQESLMALPGIGRSTAGAIRSLAMKQRASILDGNVKRVLVRFHAIEGWPGRREIEQQLWSLIEHYTPKNKCRQFNQAMMDIGATCCRRTSSDCSQCPLQSRCQAYTKELVNELPHRKTPKTLPEKKCQVLIIQNDQQEVFLEKRPSQGIWGGLWSLPQIESEQCPQAECRLKWQLQTEQICEMKPFRHTFSHFHLHIFPITMRLSGMHSNIAESNQFKWVKIHNLDQLGLASPIKKLLFQQLKTSGTDQ